MLGLKIQCNHADLYLPKTSDDIDQFSAGILQSLLVFFQVLAEGQTDIGARPSKNYNARIFGLGLASISYLT